MLRSSKIWFFCYFAIRVGFRGFEGRWRVTRHQHPSRMIRGTIMHLDGASETNLRPVISILFPGSVNIVKKSQKIKIFACFITRYVCRKGELITARSARSLRKYASALFTPSDLLVDAKWIDLESDSVCPWKLNDWGSVQTRKAGHRCWTVLLTCRLQLSAWSQ